MTLLEFVRAWLHANPTLALSYFKNWLGHKCRWQLSRHRKALIVSRRVGHVHLDTYYRLKHVLVKCLVPSIGQMSYKTVVPGERIGIDFYIQLGASMDLYHTPALESLGYAFPDEPYLRYKQPEAKP